jgi:hypothetical protein
MSGTELLNIMRHALRRTHIIGSRVNGIIVALDLEGRLFAVMDGEVLNRVVPFAISHRTNKGAFLNPGGDALWPAPEGNCFGYEYSTGTWRVPSAVTGAVWEVVEQWDNGAVIRAEIDLINNRQLGIPCEFERRITIDKGPSFLIQHVTETIRYIGGRPLRQEEFLLAPWSLCQFDSGPGAQVILPLDHESDIWDLYESSAAQRGFVEAFYRINAATDRRFQVGLGERVPWIEYTGMRPFRVRRSAAPLADSLRYIDIGDVSPDQQPSRPGTRLSVYCDPGGFMEIEACGGSPDTLVPGAELCVQVKTEYHRLGTVS